ncbi:MAG: hypothetical protein IKK39_02535, partial [Thermoguttaceae bacterium]|nr:hypothetical protein [Thermoguttaceae bacterium]
RPSAFWASYFPYQVGVCAILSRSLTVKPCAFCLFCSAQTNILRSARRAAAKRLIDLRERSLLRLLGFLPSLSSRRLRDFIALASR